MVDVGDTDGDGVINDLDNLCPNTPQGEPVNEQGCSQSELDDDDDGVMNNLDLCPDTPAATAVDTDGCTTEQRNSDSDGDGLNDPEDNCPNTETGQSVDENGCSQAQRDTDGDGISDLDDACDDTPPGFPILSNGCTDENALDTDLDGDGYFGVYTYDTDPRQARSSTSRAMPSPAIPPNGLTETVTVTVTTLRATTPMIVPMRLGHPTTGTLVASTKTAMVGGMQMNRGILATIQRNGKTPTETDLATIGATPHGPMLEILCGPDNTSRVQPTPIIAHSRPLA